MSFTDGKHLHCDPENTYVCVCARTYLCVHKHDMDTSRCLCVRIVLGAVLSSHFIISIIVNPAAKSILVP